MATAYSCSGSDYTFGKSFGALYKRSISFHGGDASGVTRSTSFKGCDSDPSVLKAFGSGKMTNGRSLSFNMKTNFPSDTDNRDLKGAGPESLKPECVEEDVPRTPVSGPSSPKHRAAVKLQKVYKSFRTRRKLADCAVLVEQRWWKLLDYALLNGSSVSYFGIEKVESVISRWARARTKAAMVGKGLSKNGKARKLALQHWLEAIDPRHRYGHNLHFYYVRWLHCESRQPFFYWLDVGEGKEVNLEQHCPRWKLQQQCIKYLGPKEREAYEVVVEDGKLLYKQSRQLLDTSEGPTDSKWIFVLSASKILYVGQKIKGTFQHSSFLAGGATSAAGRLVAENGVLKAVWAHSGHYRPTDENFQEFVSFLTENNVDLNDVKKSPTDEKESALWKTGSLRSSSSDPDFTSGIMTESTTSMWEDEAQEHGAIMRKDNAVDEPKLTDSCEVSNEQIDKKLLSESQMSGKRTSKNQTAFDRYYSKYAQNLFREFEGDSEEEGDDKSDQMEETETNRLGPSGDPSSSNSLAGPLSKFFQTREPATAEQHYIYHKRNLFEEECDDSGEPAVPKEMILDRINSRKGMKSYQLGKQLSFKWTTGAGPRIGCVRDYPSELQFHALEQVSLSPRSAKTGRALSSPRPTNPSPRSFAVEFLR